MRRWVLRSVFNSILFASALVVTSLFILQHQQTSFTNNNNNSNSAPGQQPPPPPQPQQRPQSAYFFIGNRQSPIIAAAVSDNNNNNNNNDDDEYAGEPPPAAPLQQQQQQPSSSSSTTDANKNNQKSLLPTSLNCEINGEYTIECLFYKNGVYFPFEFLAKYFEIYGHFKTPPSSDSRNNMTFQFEHSNTAHNWMNSNETSSAVRHECDGAFMNFASFNVERRNKVKFVSVANGVPLSIQWDVTRRGYHFATQVAQFGLSYYSKLVNRQQQQQQQQTTTVPLQFHPPIKTKTKTPPDDDDDCYADQSISNNNFLKFSCKSFDLQPIRVPVTVDDATASSFFQKFPILNLTYEFTSTNGAISFELQMEVVAGEQQPLVSFSKPTNRQQRTLLQRATPQKTRRLLVMLNYRCQNGVDDVTSRFIGKSSPLLMVEINYSVPECPTAGRQTMLRFLQIDVLKGLHILPNEAPPFLRKLAHTDLSLASIDAVKLQGAGVVFGAKLVQQADRDFVLLAADWLVRNQNQDGAWPIPIGRQLLNGELHLEPGWHDAMAQGQAMSLLVRAFKMTGQSSYALAALKASQPFNIAASTKRNGGVVNRLFDKYDWYEEYPTRPGLFVLNGFIYSLIGLYDTATCLADDVMRMTTNSSQRDLKALLTRTKQLYETGLETLRQTLPLFDTGYATFYDLRHLSLPGSQPNIARWDYHDAHVRQLCLLAKIDNNNSTDIWLKTARRWYGYMRGIRAPHN